MSPVKSLLLNPLRFVRLCWPGIRLYRQQADILTSLDENIETYVHAAHELGKDFISALGVIWFFSSRNPCKIVTTSSSQDQLRAVLWSEMKHLIESSAYPLNIEVGDMQLRRIRQDGSYDPRCLVLGKVVKRGESFQGFHLPNDKPRTLCVFDEASSIEDEFYDAASSWAHRILVVGNPLPCNNFFFRGCTQGDLKDPAKKEPKDD